MIIDRFVGKEKCGLRGRVVEVEICRNLQRNAEDFDRDLYRFNKYDERIRILMKEIVWISVQPELIT